MTQILVLHWIPGSAGDLIHSLLLDRPDLYRCVIDGYHVNDDGRIVARLARSFVDLFDGQEKQWYWRTWSVEDLDKIHRSHRGHAHQILVIPTHSYAQAQFIKNNCDGCRVLGINYPDNMYPLVVKNWVIKVGIHDETINQIYSQPVHEYFKNKNVFGEFLLSQELQNGQIIPRTCHNQSDITIDLEDIYCQKLHALSALGLDTAQSASYVGSWLSKQPKLCRYRYPLPVYLQAALGYNSRAPLADDLDVPLDGLDNLLIKQHRAHPQIDRLIPKFSTLRRAREFFLTHSTDNYS